MVRLAVPRRPHGRHLVGRHRAPIRAVPGDAHPEEALRDRHRALGSPVAEDGVGRGVRPDDAAVEVVDEHALRDGGEDRLQLRGAPARLDLPPPGRLLHALQGGDVAEEDRDPAVAHRVRRDARPHVQGREELLELDGDPLAHAAAELEPVAGGGVRRLRPHLPEHPPQRLPPELPGEPLLVRVDAEDPPVAVHLEERVPVLEQLHGMLRVVERGGVAVRVHALSRRPPHNGGRAAGHAAAPPGRRAAGQAARRRQPPWSRRHAVRAIHGADPAAAARVSGWA